MAFPKVGGAPAHAGRIELGESGQQHLTERKRLVGPPGQPGRDDQRFLDVGLRGIASRR